VSVELTETQKQVVAHYANRLPFVTWDRFTSHTEDNPDGDAKYVAVTMYGWIGRDDGRADFVILAWFYIDQQQFPWSVTSSADRSEEISRLLYHDQGWWKPGEHVPCQRVEGTFDEMVDRIVRL
jgi:hypothetical protein